MYLIVIFPPSFQESKKANGNKARQQPSYDPNLVEVKAKVISITF